MDLGSCDATCAHVRSDGDTDKLLTALLGDATPTRESGNIVCYKSHVGLYNGKGCFTRNDNTYVRLENDMLSESK